MNLHRIAKGLRREATRHPMKMGVLGLLAVVALWFWIPLAWGWISTSDRPKSAAKIDPAEKAWPPMPKGEVTKRDRIDSGAAGQLPGPSPEMWKELVERIEGDPRTSVAKSLPGRRNPFQTLQTKVEVSPEPTERPAIVHENVTPEQLGLVLSSTIVGPRRRVAQIGGKVLEQGSSVLVGKDGQQYQFELIDVKPGRVILERGGETFELEIPSPAGSELIELVETKG